MIGLLGLGTAALALVGAVAAAVVVKVGTVVEQGLRKEERRQQLRR